MFKLRIRLGAIESTPCLVPLWTFPSVPRPICLPGYPKFLGPDLAYMLLFPIFLTSLLVEYCLLPFSPLLTKFKLNIYLPTPPFVFL